MTRTSIHNPENISLVEKITSIKGMTHGEALQVLSHIQRQYLIVELGRHSPSVSLETLARAVTSRLLEYTGNEMSAHSIRDVRLQLHHWHLPKLDRAGLIEYNANQKVIQHITPELQNIGAQRKLKQ